MNYDLYGVIVHYGPSVLSGHYTAFVKVDDIWYLCDDTRVITLLKKKVSLFLFFFKKKRLFKFLCLLY